MTPSVDEPTYYDRPALKEPVWIWSVPAYFYAGGLAGAAMTLGLAAQIAGGSRLRRFAERCRWIGALGGGLGSILLIADLGRPERFLYMLRVFRPTSPMSIGSWVLATATPLSAGSALLTRASGFRRILGNWFGIQAGILGLPLATYTGVLLSNTAVPVWQQARRELPLLFGASAAASLASLLELLPSNASERHVAARLGLVSRGSELVAARLVERAVTRVPGVGQALITGAAGALWTTSAILTAASLVLSLAPVSFRGKRSLTGAMGTLAGLALRFAVFQAGRASARDPRATFRSQRAGL